MASRPGANPDLYLGIDLGTSGVRAIAIDGQGRVAGQARSALPAPQTPVPGGSEQAPALWWQACRDTLAALAGEVDPGRVRAIAVDGTSGTLLLADDEGRPLGPALMYNDGRSRAEADQVAAVAPERSAAHGATSALAKLIHMQPGNTARYALHQADWISAQLSGRWGISDANNCLKLGYDPIERRWPQWLDKLALDRRLLPEVVEPGTRIGPVRKEIAEQFGFRRETQIVAGTTDSTAAFMATGAEAVGEAVTSLGSTLVMKVIGDRPLFSPRHGVYSQPLGNRWLIGGGSNSGGAVLLHYFSREALAEMTPLLQPDHATGLGYYPLVQAGERFPVNDSRYPPRLTPRPESDLLFFQGMLEGMAAIEEQGYRLLAELGAPYPVNLRSAGGGSLNPAWTRIRQQRLQVPFVEALHQEAAYGSALLARRGTDIN